MKYKTGEVAKVGDIVQLWEGNLGKVVCSIDTNEYSKEYAFNEWSYLKVGILIMSDSAGLVHKTSSDEDLKLIKRSG
ncbi:MAG: hypothetical protein HRT70_10100 [Flavobacteriaceae bacterium]|nr:hypothetical protein [Flavobacteriaceae bacterium]|tara:strand:- start:33 stop:263 length:231 start_codon:yes stop_codon:yes gene_type:complete